jgi:hypothetical protein
VGAAVGALVGSRIRTERWETVPASGPAFRIWPGVDRTTVMVTARF